MFLRIALLAFLPAASCLAQAAPEPVIDVHMHAVPAASQGPPPVSLCAPPEGYPPAESGAAWGGQFMALLKNPQCARPLVSAMTDQEMLEKTLAVMKRRNVTGVVSGPLTGAWKKAGGERVIPSLWFNMGPDEPSPEMMREMFRSGRYSVLGEVGIQYQGIEPGDPRFEPYLAMAEELDIPVAIHVGTGPPGAPFLGSGRYRARLHSPFVLEEVLVKHPRLRVNVMHAGWPMIDDLLAMLWTYPQLYVDTGVISYAIPRAAFYDYLRRIVEAGFGKRVMFGSDQMVWPEAVERAIGAIESAPFLTREQKRDILYNNAARFLRLR